MPTPSGRLAGKVCVVTGAGSGIGLAAVRRLAEDGADVVCADLDEASGKAAAAEVGGEFIATDVTSEEDVRALFAQAVSRSARSTSPSTTPGSRRRMTTRS